MSLVPNICCNILTVFLFHQLSDQITLIRAVGVKRGENKNCCDLRRLIQSAYPIYVTFRFK